MIDPDRISPGQLMIRTRRVLEGENYIIPDGEGGARFP